MKVSLNNIAAPRNNTGDYKQAKTTDTKGQDQQQSYDKITIGTSSLCDLPNNQFISVLKNRLSAEVKTGASNYTLTDLGNQVALGQYDINIASVVKKIMLDSGESSS